MSDWKRRLPFIKRRSQAEIDSELDVNHAEGQPLPGGAEGGDESPAADRPGAFPARGDSSPLGDTDQHSS